METQKIAQMRSRWMEFARRNLDNAELIWEIIQGMYNRGGYHNLDHISDCLTKLDEFIDFNECLDEHLDSMSADIIEWSIWFHDIIYVPGSGQNELLSAQIARILMGRKDVVMSMICDTINSTTHIGIRKDDYLYQKAMCDIDLSCLGATSEVFEGGYQLIREEYNAYSDVEFIKGRKKFLQDMLKRPKIFQTQYFAKKYELQAQENLKRQLEILGHGKV